ncbi:MAG: hypothetical protein ACK5TQ_11785 [Acetobacteraceae bacterium]
MMTILKAAATTAADGEDFDLPCGIGRYNTDAHEAACSTGDNATAFCGCL